MACFIRANLNILDEFLRDADRAEKVMPLDFGNVYLGAPCKPTTFAKLEMDLSNDTAFLRFRLRFGEFINTLLPAADGKWRQFNAQHVVCFSMMHIYYLGLLCLHCITDTRVPIPQSSL